MQASELRPYQELRRWIDEFVDKCDGTLTPLQCAVRFRDAIEQAFVNPAVPQCWEGEEQWPESPCRTICRWRDPCECQLRMFCGKCPHAKETLSAKPIAEALSQKIFCEGKEPSQAIAEVAPPREIQAGDWVTVTRLTESTPFLIGGVYKLFAVYSDNHDNKYCSVIVNGWEYGMRLDCCRHATAAEIEGAKHGQ